MTKSVTVKTFEGIEKFIRKIPTYYSSQHIQIIAMSRPRENWWGNSRRVSCRLFAISIDGLERSWISSSASNRAGMNVVIDVDNFIVIGDESEIL